MYNSEVSPSQEESRQLNDAIVTKDFILDMGAMFVMLITATVLVVPQTPERGGVEQTDVRPQVLYDLPFI